MKPPAVPPLPNTLTSPVAGPLLVPGCLVIEAGRSGMTGAKGVVVTMPATPKTAHCAAVPTHLSVWWETVCPSMVTSITHGTGLDLNEPAGVDRARRWYAAHIGSTLVAGRIDLDPDDIVALRALCMAAGGMDENAARP